MRPSKFIFYLEWLRTMEDAQLNNGERSRLIDAIVNYADKGTTPTLPRLLMAIFSPIKATIDRDFDKYALKAATNRENGARGGRPKKPKETQENPLGYFGFSEKTEKTQSHDNVNDNVNDNVFVNDAQQGAPDQKERNDLYLILFWRNVVNPHHEIGKFWEYNETRRWKALNTPSKRLKAVTEWQPTDTNPRVRPEFLDMWYKVYKKAVDEKGEFFAGGFIDPRAKCICQGSEAKIVVSDPAVREYIMQTRPQEILDYIGNLKLTTAAP